MFRKPNMRFQVYSKISNEASNMARLTAHFLLPYDFIRDEIYNESNTSKIELLYTILFEWGRIHRFLSNPLQESKWILAGPLMNV